MRKKLFAILMSAMMMVTFMPSMAFAASTGDVHDFGHVKTVAVDKAKCGGTATVYQLKTCEDCEDQILVASAEEQKHDMETLCLAPEKAAVIIANEAFKEINDWTSEQRTLKMLDIAKNVIAERQKAESVFGKIAAGVAGNIEAQITNAVIANTYNIVLNAAMNFVNQQAGRCFFMVDHCKTCGKYFFETEKKRDTLLKNASDHVMPAGTAACAESYVCEKCGKTIKTATLTNAQKIAAYVAELEEAISSNGLILNVNKAKKAIAALLDVKAPASHKWVKTVVKAGCGTSIVYTCENCGLVKSTFVSKLLGKEHSMVEYVLAEPTCTTAGVVVQRCENCGKIGLNDIKFTKELGHDYETIEVAPTCTTPGFTVKTCKTCNKVLLISTKYIKATGHEYQYTSLVDPSCASAGLYAVSCTKCGKTEYHYGEDKSFFTGFNKELKTAVKIPATKATGHNYVGFEKYKDADCTNNEIWAKKCTKCGHFDVCETPQTKDMLGTKLGHDYKVVEVAATCLTPGYTVGICTRCEQSYQDEFGNETADIEKAKYNKTKAIGGNHDFEDASWKVIKKATIFEDGTKALVCNKCGAYDVHSHELIEPKIAYGKPIVNVKGKTATVTVRDREDAVSYEVQYRKVGAEEWTTVETLTQAGKVSLTLNKGNYAFRIVATSTKGLQRITERNKISIK